MEIKLKDKTIRNESITERLPKPLIKVCRRFEIDEQVIDWETEMQKVGDMLDKYAYFVQLVAKHSTLNPAEKETAISELMKVNIKKQEQAVEQKTEEENKNLRIEEEERILNEFKQVDEKLLNSPSFWQMRERIKMVVSGFYDVVFVVSEGGWSKTHTGFQLTKGIDTAYISCKVTPLELYHLLYENRDRQVIILDDLKWENEQIVSLLKGAWQSIGNGKRIVQYNSSKIKIPKVFEVKARFICFANRIPKTTDMDALISRTLFYNFSPSYKEKIFLIEQVSKREYKGMNEAQRQKVVEYIKRNTNPATEGLNLRTFLKICDYYRYDLNNWEKLAGEELKNDPRTELVYQLVNSGKPVNEQIEEFKLKTSECRATFFNIKKRVGL